MTDDYKPMNQGPWKVSPGYGATSIVDAEGKQVASVRYRKGFYNVDAVKLLPQIIGAAAGVLEGHVNGPFTALEKVLSEALGIKDRKELIAECKRIAGDA